MLFTVLINNFNYSQYIAESIQSVLDQTFADFELIIVDDGSTDMSREVIRLFTDPRIKTIFKPNGGQGSAFQAGIDLACGEYIAFLDSDDIWTCNKLEHISRILTSYPEIILLQNSLLQITTDGQSIGNNSIPKNHSGFYDPISDYKNLNHELPFRPTSCIVGSTMACKRLSLHPEEWRIDADTPLLAGLSVLGQVYFLNEPLTHYRVHTTNATRNQTWWSIIYRIKRFYDSVNEHIEQQGESQRFAFDKSDIYLDALICKIKWHTPRGIWLRLGKKVRDIKQMIR